MLHYILVAGLAPVVFTGFGEFLDHLSSRRLRAELLLAFARV